MWGGMRRGAERGTRGCGQGHGGLGAAPRRGWPRVTGVSAVCPPGAEEPGTALLPLLPRPGAFSLVFRGIRGSWGRMGWRGTPCPPGGGGFAPEPPEAAAAFLP